jgi:hypothetical protein
MAKANPGPFLLELTPALYITLLSLSLFVALTNFHVYCLRYAFGTLR